MVDSGQPWRRTETVKAFKAEMRKLARVTDHEFHFAWTGQLASPEMRARIWAVLGHFPGDHGITLTHGGQSFDRSTGLPAQDALRQAQDGDAAC